MKRIISFLLAAVLLISLIPGNVLAQNTQQPAAINNNVSIEGTDDFGQLLTQDIQQEQIQEKLDNFTGYNIIDLKVEGNTATVEFSAKTSADLVVAIYTEDRSQLLTSGTVNVTADQSQVTVTLPGTLPEYFHASAYMVDPADQSPLCSALHTSLYTKNIQDLLNSTVEDYDPELVVNLDDNNDTNFAVYGADTIVVEPQSGFNKVVSMNPDTRTYVIENPSSEIRSLMYGDVLSLPYNENKLLLAKVDRVTISGNTATVIGLPIEMEDVFDYVKIEADGNGEQAEVNMDTADEGVTFEGFTESEPPTRAIDGDHSKSKDFEYGISKELVGYNSSNSQVSVKIEGGFKLNLTVGVSYYISLRTQELNFYVSAAGTFNLSVTGKATTEISLGTLAIPVVPGVNVGMSPTLNFEFSGKVEFTAKITRTIGFKFKAGDGFSNTSRPLTCETDFQAEATVSVSFDLAPEISIIDPDIARGRLSMPIGVMLTAKLTGSSTEGEDALIKNNHACVACVDIAIDFTFSMSIKLTFLDSDRLTYSKEFLSVTARLKNLYYSIDHLEFGSGKCPYRKYPLTLTVLKTDGQPLADAQITCTPENCTLTTDAKGTAQVYLPKGTYALSAAKGDYAGNTQVTVNGETKETISVILTGTVSNGVKWSLTESGDLTIFGNGAIPSYSETSRPWSAYINSVTGVTISGGITGIGANVFQNHSNLKSVYIGDSVSSMDLSAFNGLSLSKFTVSSSNNSYTMDQKGVLYSKSKTTLYKAMFPLVGSYDIPNSVTNVASKAFAGQTGISLIHFTGDAPSIASDAFSGMTSEALYCTRTTGWTQSKLQNYGGTITWSSYDGLLGSGTFGNQLVWNFFNDGVLRISGAGDMPNYTSTSKAPWYKYRESIKKVVLANGITGIGNYSFYDCTVLEEITIPATVSHIGSYAFYNCSSLADITIPKAVTAISTYTFYNCSSLNEISIPEGVSSIESYAFYGCSSLQNINIPENVAVIDKYTFYNCSSLQSIVLHDGITAIDDYAFYNCSSLPELVIPHNVTNIGRYAFAKCSGIISLRIRENWDPDFSGLTIGANAFANCTSLRSAKLSDSVIRINGTVFFGCGSLESISIPFVGDQRRANTETTKYPLGYLFGGVNYTGAMEVSQNYNTGSFTTYYIPSSLKTVIVTDGEIINSAFRNCTNLQTVVIPETATAIGDYAFAGCTGIQSIIIPENITTIGRYSFQNCTGLTGIVIPNSVTIIDDYAFEACANLTQVTLGNSIAKIGYSTFRDCAGLTEITFPESLTIIGGAAFQRCTGLTEISIPDSVTEIGTYCFYDCTNLTSVTFGNGLTKVGQHAFYDCSKLTAVHIADLDVWCKINFASYQANPLYYAKNLYLNGKLVTEVEFPADVTSISAYAFTDCVNLTCVSIPDNITTIGEGAFSDCEKLTEIVIPDSVTAIGKYAFADCSGLTEMTIPFVGGKVSGNTTETSPFSYIFGTVPSSLKTVTVTGGYISENDFKNCKNLVTVNIMEGIKNISSNSFPGCTSLQNLSIPGKYLLASPSYVTNYKDYHIGHLFGTASYTGSEPVNASSNESVSGTVTYYIPSSLRTVTVISDTIPTGSFQNCTMLTNVLIGNHVTGIASGAFSACPNLSYTTYDNATYLGNAENPYVALISATSRSITSCKIHPDTKVIADSAFHVGDSGFYGCYALTDIIIPDQVTHIGNTAFRGCSELSSVTIGSSVVSIGNEAFYDCSSLSAISIPDSLASVGTDAFYSYPENKLQYNIYDRSTYLGNSKNPYVILMACESTAITSCEIHPDTKIIYQQAFYNCRELTDITIPDGVADIGKRAFESCTSLTAITLPDSIKSVGFRAFGGCSALKSLSVPFAASSINAGNTDAAHLGYMFGTIKVVDSYGNLIRTEYDIPNSLQTLTIRGGDVSYNNFTDFEYSKVVNVHILEGVKSVRETALAGFPKLKELTVPGHLLLNATEDYSFYHLGYLFKIGSADGYQPIEIQYYDQSISGNRKITYYIPTTLTKLTILGNTIPKASLLGCSMLTELVVGSDITEIEYSAFSACTELNKITFLGDAPTFGGFTLDMLYNATAYYPAGNATWTADLLQKYSDNITWIAYTPTKSIAHSAAPVQEEELTVTQPESTAPMETVTEPTEGTVAEPTEGTVAETAAEPVFEPITEEEPETAAQSVAITPEVTGLGMMTRGPKTDYRIHSLGTSAESPATAMKKPSAVRAGNQKNKSRTVTFEGLDAGEEYIFLSLINEYEENPLIPDNLLYIDQLVADSNGTITVTYIPRISSDSVYEMVTGGKKPNLADATVTWSELEDNGDLQYFSPTVTYNGTALTEGTDYVLEGDISFTVGGSYTCYVVGIGDYTGSYTCEYTVKKGIHYSMGLQYRRQTDLSNGAVYYAVIGIGTCRDTDIVIPPEYDGHPVKVIYARAFENCKNITSVTIPDSITRIHVYAFCGCTNLQNVTIPNGITSIEDYTFSGCTSLRNITIPDSVISIDYQAFYGCTSLQNIIIPNSVRSIGYRAFYNCTSLQNITIPDSVIAIEAGVFYGCTSLSSVSIPNSVTVIGTYAFSGCTSLSSISLPNSITKINQRMFEGCTSLSSVSIPNSVTSIESDAFSGCTSLTSVTIPDSVTTIDYSVFKNCSSLTSVIIPKSVTCIKTNAFQGCTSLTDVYISDIAAWCAIEFGDSTANPISYAKRLFVDGILLTELIIPDGVAKIGRYAFYSCNSITNVKLSDTVTSIGSNAFYNCSNLTQAVIGNNVTDIEMYAFNGCLKLASINIPSSVTYIGNNAFHLCTQLGMVYISDISSWCNITFATQTSNPIYYAQTAICNGTLLTELVLPSSITMIRKYAFAGYERLTSVTIPDSVTSIGMYAFEDCTQLTKVTIGNGVVSIGYGAFTECSALTNVTFGNSVTTIESRAFWNCRKLTNITLPDCITKIGSYAFYNCRVYKTYNNCRYLPTENNPYFVLLEATNQYITSCEIHSDTKVIADSALEGCTDLTTITVPQNVKNIGNSAFSGCSALVNVTIPDGINSIANYVFYNCSSLTYVALPKSITNIGYSAFSGCTNLISITIPEGVTSIDYGAFYSCSSLQSITIPDSVTSIGDYAFYNCSALSDIIIPNGITRIGEYMFYYCNNLTDISIPHSVDSIGKYAFYGCNKLSDVTFSRCMSSIEDYAFYNCVSLTQITIPNSVTSIGGSAFSGCKQVKVIRFNGDAPTFGSNVFSSVKATAYYPAGNATWTASVRKSYGGTITWVAEEPCTHSDYTILPAVSATCTEDGKTEGKQCTKCLEIFQPQQEIPALGHSAATLPAVAATCTAAGKTAGKYCTVCHTTLVAAQVIPALGHSYETYITKPTCTASGYTVCICTKCRDQYVAAQVPATGHSFADGKCTVCGAADPNFVPPVVMPDVALKFKSANLKLESDLTIYFQVEPAVFANGAYENPRVEYSIPDVKNGTVRTAVVTEYTIGSDGRLNFPFTGISPRMMKAPITAVLYGTFAGQEYSFTQTYAVTTYCYNQLNKTANHGNTKFMNLLADLLNFGTAHQVYAKHETNNLINAEMTSLHKGFASTYALELKNLQNTAYKTVTNPTAKFNSAALTLQNAVLLQLTMTCEDITNVTLKIVADGVETIIPASDWTETTTANLYTYDFAGLKAKQMGTAVYASICRNGVAISNTLQYSIETYAARNIDKATHSTELKNLLKMMMYYAKSAKAYFS